MILGRVAGRIYSTIHHSVVENQKLLIIDKLDALGQTGGGYLIAMDAVGAGAGETVVVLDEGTGARQIIDNKDAPLRSIVVGIVDEVSKG
jgi:ethanolamine utilization protein EutN